MQQFTTESQLPVTSGDRKTLHDGDTSDDPDIPNSTVINLPPDFPPESFWLSKDAEFDWFDRNAFLNRNDSTNRTSNSTNLNQIVNPSHSVSSSQRYYSANLKSKAAIIGLPKTQKTTFVDSKRRQCKTVNVRLFPMRSFSVGKTPATVPVTEPTSPKVSCIGRVRSKRCRSRRKSAGLAIEPVRSTSQRSGRVCKSGLLSKITSLFRSQRHNRRSKSNNGKSLTEKVNVTTENSVTRKICGSVKPVSGEPETPSGEVLKLVNSEPATPSGPPGLGGMIRFASGHRSGYWEGLDDYDVAGRHSLDSRVPVSA